MVALVNSFVFGQPGEFGQADRRGGVYQRRAFEFHPMHGGRRSPDRGHQVARFAPPNVEASWFQRPYPYHLDYYRMRYGGSYAPYFGNLYGPPQVVTAPPYYGPYYGSWDLGGYAAGYPAGYGYGDTGNPGPGWCPCDEKAQESSGDGGTTENIAQ
jgi:hypothetical protein